jgi:hypothetical protein
LPPELPLPLRLLFVSGSFGTIPLVPEPRDLEAEIDRLYALPLDQFVAARDELARALRRADRRPDADRVKGLRKPTVGAWALNQAVRTRRDDLRELLDAGDALRVAQERLLAGGDRADLREAGERERELVSRLAEAAVAIGGEAGRSGALEPRLRATLHAAALDESARAELAAGRFVREREPVALGAVAVGEPEPARSSATRAGAGRRAGTPSRATRGRGRGRAEEPAAKRRGERGDKLAELQERVREAQAEAEEAASALADAERGAASARERAEAAAADRKDAVRAERAAHKAVQEAERAERDARKAVQDAEGAKRAARKAAQQAERALERVAREAERALSSEGESAAPRRRRR